jgi:uncharacterized membrane protein
MIFLALLDLGVFMDRFTSMLGRLFGSLFLFVGFVLMASGIVAPFLRKYEDTNDVLFLFAGVLICFVGSTISDNSNPNVSVDDEHLSP